MFSKSDKPSKNYSAIISNIALSSTLFASLAISIFVGVRIMHWPFIENLAGDRPFGDLGVLLAMTDFLRLNPDGNVYAKMVEYSYLPNYPLLLPTLLGFTGMGLKDLLVVGIVFALSVTTVLTALSSWSMAGTNLVKTVERGIILLLAFVSPPLMLLLERGNYDSLIFVLVVLACALAIRFRHAAGVVLLLASLFKLFPVGSLLALARRGRGLLLPMGLLGLFGLYALFTFSELKMISANTPRPHWVGFGWQVFAGYAEEFFPDQSEYLYLLFALALNAVAASVGLWFYKANSLELNDLATRVMTEKFAEMLFVTGTLVLITAFAIGNAFDYRLVFLLLPLSAIVRHDSLGSPSGRVLTFASILVLFLSLATYQLQPVGDFITAATMTVFAALTWRVVSQHFVKKAPAS